MPAGSRFQRNRTRFRIYRGPCPVSEFAAGLYSEKMITWRIIVALIAGACLYAQTPDEKFIIGPEKFDVASLKPSPPNATGVSLRTMPGKQRYSGQNVNLRTMIYVAYRLKPDQITGGPSWLDNAHFDMEAKAEKESSLDELHTMPKNLMADRFHLRFHIETKELPAYVLTVDRDGPKHMTAHEPEKLTVGWIDVSMDIPLHLSMKATASDMAYFVFRLQEQLDRPVVDQTDLKGGYDFTLGYTMDRPPGLAEDAVINGKPLDSSGPTLFEALRQQLGLRLESRKASLPVMVIDHADKPTEN